MGARARIAVVGCGYWGSKHVRVISETPGARLALAVDSRAERREYIEATYSGVETAGGFERALGAGIDGVILATPIASHYELARQALEAGKHVLVEKPLATSSRECRELIALAEREGRVLMVGHTFEYHPAVEHLRQMIERGELGQLYYVDCARLNLGLFQRDANVMWDLAPHDLSIVHRVLGASATRGVSAQGSGHILPGVADVAFANIEYEGGARAHLHVSWLDPCKVRRVTVVGSRAMVVFNDVAATEKIRVYDKRFTFAAEGDRYSDYQSGYHTGSVVIPPVSGAEPLRLEVEDFVAAIVGDGRVRADGWSGLRVVEALEAADRSMRAAGRYERVGDDAPGYLDGGSYAGTQTAAR